MHNVLILAALKEGLRPESERRTCCRRLEIFTALCIKNDSKLGRVTRRPSSAGRAADGRTLKPKTVQYSDYKVTFIVFRHVTELLPLEADDGFAYIFKNLMKVKKDPSATIIVKVATKPNHCKTQNGEAEVCRTRCISQ